MYEGRKIAAIAPAYNELGKIEKVAEKMCFNLIDLPIVVDDGSDDASGERVREVGAIVVRHDKRRGLGAAIRSGISYARDHGTDIVVILAGNGKDDPAEIPRLLDPIVNDDFDYVQGSRYLAGGNHGRMPFHRRFATRLHPILVRLVTGYRGTDSTNGFRAYKASIFEDLGIDIWQDWLDGTELEFYLHLQIIAKGGRITEVPVSKIYPQHVKYGQYTKVKPIADWWRILKPLVYQAIGRRR